MISNVEDENGLETETSFPLHIIVSLMSLGSLTVTVLFCFCCQNQKRSTSTPDENPICVTVENFTSDTVIAKEKNHLNGGYAVQNGMKHCHNSSKEKHSNWWLPQLLYEMRQFKTKSSTKQSNSDVNSKLRTTSHQNGFLLIPKNGGVILRQDSRSSRKLPPLPDGFVEAAADQFVSSSGGISTRDSTHHPSYLSASRPNSQRDSARIVMETGEGEEDHYDRLPAELHSQPQFSRMKHDPPIKINSSNAGFVNGSYCHTCTHRTGHHEAEDYDELTSEIDPIYSVIRRRMEICDECGCEVRSVLSSHVSTPNSSFRSSSMMHHGGVGVAASKLVSRLKTAAYNDGVMSPWRQLRHQPYPSNARTTSGMSTPNSQLYSRIYRLPNRREPPARNVLIDNCDGPCSPADDSMSSWSLLGLTNPRPELPRRDYGHSELEIVEQLRQEDRKRRSHSVDRDNNSAPFATHFERSFSEKIHHPQCFTPNHRSKDLPRPSGFDKRSPVMKQTASYSSISGYSCNAAAAPRPHFESISRQRSPSTESHDNLAFISHDETTTEKLSSSPKEKQLTARRKLELNLNGLKRNLIYDDVYNSQGDIPSDKASIFLEMGSFRHMDSDVDLSGIDKRVGNYKLMTPLMEQSVEGSYFEDWAATNRSNSSVAAGRSHSGSKSTLSRGHAAVQEDDRWCPTNESSQPAERRRNKSIGSLNLTANKRQSFPLPNAAKRSKSIDYVATDNGMELIVSSDSSSSTSSLQEELEYLMDDQKPALSTPNYISKSQIVSPRNPDPLITSSTSACPLSAVNYRKSLVTTDSMRQIQYLDLSNFSLNQLGIGPDTNRKNNVSSSDSVGRLTDQKITPLSARNQFLSQPTIRFTLI